MIKLNIGCGTDYREGWINIDGSNTLKKVDKVINISKESILLKHFKKDQVDFILAQDIIEHHFHWEAVKLLEDFYTILNAGGGLQIRVPDAEAIIESKGLLLETKLTMLFGGQDKLQHKNKAMDESRKNHPSYFCHKYGWTIAEMTASLKRIGFKNVKCFREGTNFVTYANK